MLLARIHALDPRAQAVVRVAAAGGRDVHHELLAAAAGLPEPELSDALRDAVRQHVLVARRRRLRVPPRALQRGRLRRAAARRAGAAARRLRRRAGGAARPRRRQHGHRRGRDRAPLAARRRRAARAGRRGARGHRGRARRRARRGRASTTSAPSRCGTASPTPSSSRASIAPTLLARAADAAAWTGDPAEAIELVDAAIALRRAGRRAGARRGAAAAAARFLWQLGRAPESVPGLERAVALIPADPPSAERAEALGGLGLMLMLSGQPARSRAYAEQALAVARAAGARAEEADALNCLGIRPRRPRRPGGRAGASAPGAGRSRRTSAARTSCRRRPYCCPIRCGATASCERSVEIALEGAEVARRAGLEMRERMCKCNAAQAAFELGRWDLVDRISREMLARELHGR